MPKFAWYDRIGNLTQVTFVLSATGRSRVLILGTNYPIITLTVLLDAAAAVLVVALLLIAAAPPVWWAQLTTYALCSVHFLSCVLVMCTDPGIIRSEDVDVESGDHIRCADCAAVAKRSDDVIHCDDCGVCVLGQHHHCTFTSKCIGQRNQLWFWLWIGTLASSFLIPPLIVAT